MCEKRERGRPKKKDKLVQVVFRISRKDWKRWAEFCKEINAKPRVAIRGLIRDRIKSRSSI